MFKMIFLIFSFISVINFYGQENMIKLPQPRKDSSFSVERAIYSRRSVREYQDKDLKLEDVSQLLWAAQGITSRHGLRSAPSAGALYPVEIYLVATKVEKLQPGVYKYIPLTHSLRQVLQRDVRKEVCNAALGQSCVLDASATIIISVVFERVTRKYGQRGIQYTYFEAGCVAENIHLQAESLGIGTVVVGAFYDEKVKQALAMDTNETPVALMPIGYKK
jgi:SagB-type dehydrogenase family enzyme